MYYALGISNVPPCGDDGVTLFAQIQYTCGRRHAREVVARLTCGDRATFAEPIKQSGALVLSRKGLIVHFVAPSKDSTCDAITPSAAKARPLSDSRIPGSA